MSKTLSDQEKIRRLSADLELLAHITSHDLRDPLRQAIINLEEVTKLGLDKEASGLIYSTVDSINEVIYRIAVLREYSHLANPKETDDKSNINKVLGVVLERMDEKVRECNASVLYEELPEVIGSENKLITLFLEIIDNALKFNDSSSPEVKIGVQDIGEAFEFTIQDNGVGLEEVYRDLVFTLFQRLDPEEKNGSFGVGLSLCKKIVEGLGGKIWFTSDGENGTCFHFTLQKIIS